MPDALQQRFESPSSALQAPPIPNNAQSQNPEILYALDAQGNRLFPYALTPGMDKSLVPLLSETINRACQSKIGRDTLRQASETGHSFMLYAENDGRGGFYNDVQRSICMQAIDDKDFICSALVHEARHSIQFDQVPEFRETYRTNDLNFKSYILVNRAIEADAVAVQAKFGYELALLGDRGPFDVIKKGHFAAVAGSIEQAAEKGKLDHPDTLKNAADAWYKSFGVIHWYDDYYSKVEKARLAKMTHQKNLSDEQLDRFVEDLFKINGVSYAGKSAAYLKSPEKLSLSEEAYLNVQAANAACGKTDSSIEDMFAVNPITYKPMNFTHRQKSEMTPEQLKILYYQQTQQTSFIPPPPPFPPKDKKEKNLKEAFLSAKLKKFQKTLNANKRNSAVNVAGIIQDRLKNSRS